MKSADRSSRVCRAGGIVLAALTCVVVGSVQTAMAQSFFETLFGDAPRYVRPESLPPRASSYANPGAPMQREPRRHYHSSGVTSGSNGRSVAFCVRTCDGRYFPLQRHAGTSPAQICRSLCPASKTMVFSGSRIDYAVAHNGMRYADLKSAFAYRDHVIDNCTCNGMNALGLAHLDSDTDPTLRPGDIVATNEGFVSYRGTKSSKTARFSPINPSSSAWARNLSEIRIRPAPPADEAVTAPLSDEEAAIVVRKELRRAQLDN